MPAAAKPPMPASLLLEYPPLAAHEMIDAMEHALRKYADPADLYEDLTRGLTGVVVIDARKPEAYAAAHIPGASSFPHRTMNPQSTAQLPRDVLYVTYCDGIGCNASTKSALKLAKLGFSVKELIGGLDWWKRDGYPVAAGVEPGQLEGALPAIVCAC